VVGACCSMLPGGSVSAEAMIAAILIGCAVGGRSA
jgi:hypothetical protein